MNKLAVSLFLIATTLLTTACVNDGLKYSSSIDLEPSLIINNKNEMYLEEKRTTMEKSSDEQKISNTIKIPINKMLINTVSKDVKNIKYLELREDSSLEE